ncbi:CheR family methyltransferase [Oxynema aestuarii]|uniref:Chemotaxis protein CheR n=1 Tax=Oxynema aestuarii AP17 TaxID=2064643 RepID=A0A6H1U4X9_9CYAN|nr:protein-glutamate O-methyltransferase CheR [Oxynema aestuarii]QIZ73427.1 chemotaxis protein CheR [Oxynema aestuarii AP17]
MSASIRDRVAALLGQQLGWDLATLGDTSLDRAIARRMRDGAIADLPTYWQQLQHSRQEWQALIELLVVPETWFFRDRHAFDGLQHYARRQWRDRPSGEALRLLSLPCSTGEEPYSIAIALCEAGLSRERFTIEAIDLSQGAIDRARRRTYSDRAFRGQSFDLRDRYFEKTADGYQLAAAIGDRVQFYRSNPLEPLFQYRQTPYHVIFCRNLLIYLHQSARLRLLQVLEALTLPEGLLFVGSSETAIVSSHAPRFAPLREPLCFAYRRVDRHDVKPPPPTTTARSQATPPRRPSAPLKSGDRFTRPPSSNLPKPQPQSLSSIRDLANAGDLETALNLCLSYLKQEPTSAEAYLLCGEIHTSRRCEDEAERCFEKALYLSPHSYEALVHLKLLAEKRGNVRKAMLLRQRIDRLLES